jgi:HEAT repeat protein
VHRSLLWLLTALLPWLVVCGAPSADLGEGPDPAAGATVDERIVFYDSLGEPGAVENIPTLERAIGRDHVEVQLTVIEALGRIGKPEALPALRRAAGDELSGVRMNVAVAAGWIPDAETLELLNHLSADSVLKVRRAAVNSLARIRRPESVPLLIEIAREEEDETVRRAAVQALHHIGPPGKPAIPLLVELATTESEHIRWDAVSAIQSIGGREAAEAMVGQLGSDLPEIRGRAALALAQLEAQDRLGTILDALAVEQADVAAAAMARAAALLGETELSIPTLERLLQTSESWAARVESAVGLGESGDLACVPALQEAGADPHSVVRQKAAEAIKLIRSREAAS